MLLKFIFVTINLYTSVLENSLLKSKLFIRRKEALDFHSSIQFTGPISGPKPDHLVYAIGDRENKRCVKYLIKTFQGLNGKSEFFTNKIENMIKYSELLI